MYRYLSCKFIVYALLLLMTTTYAVACGPVFPNRVLSDVENVLLQTPDAYFFTELQQIHPALTAPEDRTQQTAPPHEVTHRAATNDLHSYFGEDGKVTLEENQLIAEYDSIRNKISDYHNAVDAYNAYQQWPYGKENKETNPNFPNMDMPDGLPGEFELYLRGAIAWYSGDTSTAQQAWSTILEYPKSQRRYRSTWAAFMLGKSCIKTEPEQAI